jgi:hypothetical protein
MKMRMDYEYDIFISYPYKEDGEVYADMIEDWVESCLIPRLYNWVRMDRGHNVLITSGRHAIRGGDIWPQRLQEVLARSRILVPLFCPLYFKSDWCQKELLVFLRRAETLNLRINGKCPLVVPITIYKTPNLPSAVEKIQSIDCRKYMMYSEELVSSDLSKFGKLLKNWAPDIEEKIQNAPPWQGSWLDEPFPEVESRDGSNVTRNFASEDIPNERVLIRDHDDGPTVTQAFASETTPGASEFTHDHDYTTVLALMDRFLDAAEVDEARQFGQLFLTKDGYPVAALIFDHAVNRIGQTHPFLSRMLANRAYSLIGLERFHEAVGCLKQVRELRAADGTFRSWHAVALAYAYYRLGKNRKYSDWLAYARRRPEEYAMRINGFAEYYPEIAEALVAS